jgi:hypothetical protein
MNTSGACRLNRNILFSFLVGSFNLAGRSDSFSRNTIRCYRNHHTGSIRTHPRAHSFRNLRRILRLGNWLPVRNLRTHCVCILQIQLP